MTTVATTTAKEETRRGLLAGLSDARRQRILTNLTLLLMTLPGVAMLILFNYLPMFGLVIAFKDYRFAKGVFGSEWVGLNNFRFLFGPGMGWRIVRNTVFYNVLFIFSGLVGSLTLAMLVNEIHKNKLSRIYQAMSFLPHFVSWVVVGIFANFFLRSDGGVINNLIARLGGETLFFYRTPEYWPAIMVVINLWKGVGFGTVTYLTGIMGISEEFYEAAQIDGANRWQQIWFITLPMLLPLIITVTLLQLGGIFRGNLEMFNVMVGTTNPQLYSTTDIIDTFVFRSLLQLFNLGMAGAAGLFQSIVGLIMIVVTNWTVKRFRSEQALY